MKLFKLKNLIFFHCWIIFSFVNFSLLCSEVKQNSFFFQISFWLFIFIEQEIRNFFLSNVPMTEFFFYFQRLDLTNRHIKMNELDRQIFFVFLLDWEVYWFKSISIFFKFQSIFDAVTFNYRIVVTLYFLVRNCMSNDFNHFVFLYFLKWVIVMLLFWY